MWFSLDNIVARAKRRWFAYPGSDIYGGLANARDLWPYGVEVKRNIENNRRKYFVQTRSDIIGLDSQILMNSKVREASGHVGGFNEPLIDCKKCKSRYRADKLIEEYKEKKDDKDLPKNWKWENTPPADILDYINEKKIKCPKCGALEWTEPKKFNGMFKTEQGTIEWEGAEIFLRPETAQGIFVNFKNIIDTTRSRIPFGIAQIGKVFRNEITPGNFMFRVREFYQMEIEYFVENDEKIGMKRFEEWKKASKDRWINQMGINEKKLKFRDHDKDELSFYSKGTCDVEYEFPRWRGELQGIAYRTDYDLRQHMEHSGKDLQYNDPQTGKRYVPHVVEPSRWLTRAILTVLIDAYDEEEYTNGKWEKETRTVVRFHKNTAPVKFAIIPLVKKDEKMVALAKEIYDKLSQDYMCEFDDSGNIGKCYRRQDEIGTPYCITVDNVSLEDGTVTVRDRDTMQQERLKIEQITF